MLKSNRGISTIEIILASSLLVGFVLTMAFVGKSFKQFVAGADQTVEGIYVHSHFVSQMRNMLLQTKNASGIPTQGLCSIAKTDAKKFGVAVIQLDLRRESLNSLFTSDRWNEFKPKGWKSSVKPGCTKRNSVFSRCFEPDESGLSQGSNLTDLHVLAEIIPVNLDPESKDKLFGPITLFTKGNETLDAKKVAFELSVKTFYKKRMQESIKDHMDNMKELIWSADAGECEFSGMRLVMSGTGIGDPSGKYVYGSSGFKGQLPPPLRVVFLRKSIQEGQKLRNGSITTDPDKNVSIACTERKFQCRNNPNSRSFDDNLESEMQIRYFSPNSVGELPLVDTSLQTRFMSSTSQKDLLTKSKSKTEIYVNNQRYKTHSDGNDYAYNEDTKSYDMTSPMALVPGDQVVRINFTRANQMCQKICSTNSATRYYPEYTFTLKSLRNGTDFVETINGAEPIGCTVCYTKSCKRFGLSTFGALDKQPNEPVDSRMPECALRASNSRSLDPLRKNQVADRGGNCVVATINGSNKLSFESKNCSAKMPVLCYNFGTHFLATDQTTQTANLAQVSFSQAQRRCFETGRESVKQDQLIQMFKQFGSPLEIPEHMPEVFINNASQGIFLAPETGTQIRDLIRHISVEQKFNTKTQFWIGYQKDRGGEYVATPPLVVNKDNKATERFAVYFDESGIPRVSENKHALSSSMNLTSTRPVGLAVHSLHWQGLLLVDPDQNKEFPFLCRKQKTEFFLSKRKSKKISDGSGICAKENGYFAPPLSAMDWTDSLNKVNRVSDYHSFPISDISIVEKNEFPSSAQRKFAAAWVSVQTQDGGKSFYMPDNHYMVKKVANQDWRAGIAQTHEDMQNTQGRRRKKEYDEWKEKKEDYDKYLVEKDKYDQDLKAWDDIKGSKPPKPQPPKYVRSPGPPPNGSNKKFWTICENSKSFKWTARRDRDGCKYDENKVSKSKIKGMKNFTKYLYLLSGLDFLKDRIKF